MARSEDELREAAQPWEKNFREQMILLRKAKGLNQTQLAKRLALHQLPFHQQTIQRIEAGGRPVRLNEAVLIARELGTSLTTMIASAPAGARDAMNAVDELKAGSLAAADIVNEAFDELARMSLPGVLDELLPGEAEPDAAGLYALRWAVELATLAQLLLQAEQQVRNISAGRDEDDLVLPPEYQWILDMADKWADRLSELPRYPEVPSGTET